MVGQPPALSVTVGRGIRYLPPDCASRGHFIVIVPCPFLTQANKA